MPLYEYSAVDHGCDHCQPGFETIQRITEPSLTQCPICGAPIQKLISAVAISRERRDLLGRKNLEKNGFIRYEKTKEGYVKTAGTQGPDLLRKPKS